MNPNYYSSAQVASMLGMSIDWVWKQVRENGMPHHKVGGRYKFTAEDLALYEQQTSSDPE